MVEDVLVDFLNHNLQCLVTVTAAEAMEVEIEELELVLLRELMHLAHELGRDADLPGRIVPKQVDNAAGPVRLHNVFEVGAEGLLRHLGVARKVHLLFEAALLPKDRHGASDLDVAD